MPGFVHIDFEKPIDATKIKKLSAFFEEQSGQGVLAWKKNQAYLSQDGTEFKFRHDIVSRPRKEGKAGLRYQVIGRESKGSGTYGSVNLTKYTLAFGPALPDGHRVKTKGKDGRRRVLKIQKNIANSPASLKVIQDEYERTQQAGHLHVKQPTLVLESNGTYTSYTVMDEAPGKELLDIINDDISGKAPLTLIQRFQLTRALLKALKAQVSDRNLVHRDIKPENIFVELGPPIEVTILDYGVSMYAHQPDGEKYGTYAYIAPETTQGKSCIPSDVYSLGRILSLLWGANIDQRPEHALDHVQQMPRKHLLSGLFQGITGLNPEEQKAIKTVLLGMLEIDPARRFSIKDCLQALPAFNQKAGHKKHPASAQAQKQNPSPRQALKKAARKGAWEEHIRQTYNEYIAALQSSKENARVPIQWFGRGAKIQGLKSEAETWLWNYEKLNKCIEAIRQDRRHSKTEKNKQLLQQTQEFYTQLCQYQLKVVRLSPLQKVVKASCAFVGSLLGAAIGATLGAIYGITIGALLGSVAPSFGNLIGAVLEGSAGAIEGALIGAGIGSSIALALSAYIIKTPILPKPQVAALRFIASLGEAKQGIEQQACLIL